MTYTFEQTNDALNNTRVAYLQNRKIVEHINGYNLGDTVAETLGNIQRVHKILSNASDLNLYLAVQFPKDKAILATALDTPLMDYRQEIIKYLIPLYNVTTKLKDLDRRLRTFAN